MATLTKPRRRRKTAEAVSRRRVLRHQKSAQYIELDGASFVLLPAADYEQLCDAANEPTRQEVGDIAECHRRISDRDEKSIPWAEVVKEIELGVAD